MQTFADLYILNYIMGLLDSPVLIPLKNTPIPYSSIQRLNLSDKLLSSFFPSSTPKSYSSKLDTSLWLSTELHISNLISCVFLKGSTIHFSFNNHTYSIPIPSSHLLHLDYLYSLLISCYCIRWGYWLSEVVGKGIFVIDDHNSEYFTNSVTCDCDYFRKYHQCSHTHLSSTFLSFRPLFNFLLV